MTRTDRVPLYTAEMLALAVELARRPLTDDLPERAEIRSRTCGSTLRLGLGCDAAGRIQRVGLAISACAVGQAAAAIFARHARGRNGEALDTMGRAIARWLGGDAPMPDWPDLEMLTPALPHPGRHEAILMPWRAAVQALSNRATAS